jgi:hypothetical protein
VGGLLSSLFNAFSLTSDIKSGGIATFFTQNGNAGNCGQVHQDSEHVVALPTSTYANGAHCGKKIAIVDRDTGKSATAIVADSCPTCPDPNSLDLSTSLFTCSPPRKRVSSMLHGHLSSNKYIASGSILPSSSRFHFCFLHHPLDGRLFVRFCESLL